MHRKHYMSYLHFYACSSLISNPMTFFGGEFLSTSRSAAAFYAPLLHEQSNTSILYGSYYVESFLFCLKECMHIQWHLQRPNSFPSQGFLTVYIITVCIFYLCFDAQAHLPPSYCFFYHPYYYYYSPLWFIPIAHLHMKAREGGCMALSLLQHFSSTTS